jgi:hypothetical protein
MRVVKRLTGFLYVLCLIGLVITLVILYRNIYNPYTYDFVAGYVVYLVFFILYYLSITVLNFKNLNWDYLKSRLLSFIKSFAFFCLLDLLFYLFKHPTSVTSVFKDLSTCFALSIGYTFFDLPFQKK